MLLVPLVGAHSISAQRAPDPSDWSTIDFPIVAQSVAGGWAAAPRQVAGLDSALAALAAAAATPQAARDLAVAGSLRVSANRVHVQVIARAGSADSVAAAITAAGGEVTGVAGTLLQGWLPISALERIAGLDEVELVRRPAEFLPLQGPAAGSATTEALAPMNVPAWHSAGQHGAGVKVAVLDIGFTGYTVLRGSDLPASVTARNFVDGETDAQVDGTTNHGTACAEMIHDIAPEAELYLVKIATTVDLAEAVEWLIAQQVDIISTSIGTYNQGPGDGTGALADLVRRARAAGILWVTAAGNERQTHWSGSYFDPDGDDVHNFNGGQEVNFFGPGDDRAYAVPAGVLLRVYIRWDDWAAVDQDYDLILVRFNGAQFVAVAQSADPQSGGPGQAPVESLAYVTAGPPTAYGFVVQRTRSNRNVHFEMFVPDVPRLDEIVTARGLISPADAPDAVTVAAVDAHQPYAQEPYSSQGPTNGPGGVAAGGLSKPDIAGYANVSTSSVGTSRFNGTSAATAHVAGAAALAQAATPGALPAQTAAFLSSRAIDLGLAGSDTVFGAGRVYLADPPNSLPTLAIADASVPEGNAGSIVASFTIALSAPSGAPVGLAYATANGSATAPADYVAVPATQLTFAPGETSKTVLVAINGDTVSEGNEAFFVNLSGPSNAVLGDSQGLATILDDDSSQFASKVSISDANIAERKAGLEMASFVISLAPPSDIPVTVIYTTADLTATASVDYTAIAPTPLVFVPGEISKTIQVTIGDDRLIEDNETFVVNLVSSTGADILDGQGIGTIFDDDDRIFLPTILHIAAPVSSPNVNNIFSLDFEGAFPGPVAVLDDNGPVGGVYTWGKRDCLPFAGQFSGWASGGGANGAQLACGSNYANNQLARMVFGPFSLAGARDAELRYKLWLRTEFGFDGLCALASINNNDFYGSCSSGNSNGWVDRVFDLKNVYQLGNLTGQPQVWVAFGFVSDSSVTLPGGAYVDNIIVRSCTAACPAAASSMLAQSDAVIAERTIGWRAGQVLVGLVR
jgi:hypothetical protein